MQNQRKKEIRKYFRELKKQIIPHPDKKRFLSDLKKQVIQYLDDDSTRNMDDIYAYFGTANELNEDLLATLESDSYKKKFYI